jgi:hypothetical protein
MIAPLTEIEFLKLLATGEMEAILSGKIGKIAGLDPSHRQELLQEAVPSLYSYLHGLECKHDKPRRHILSVVTIMFKHKSWFYTSTVNDLLLRAGLIQPKHKTKSTRFMDHAASDESKFVKRIAVSADDLVGVAAIKVMARMPEPFTGRKVTLIQSGNAEHKQKFNHATILSIGRLRAFDLFNNMTEDEFGIIDATMREKKKFESVIEFHSAKYAGGSYSTLERMQDCERILIEKINASANAFAAEWWRSLDYPYGE